ncbi:hypothetical protein F2P81_010203 [Scophthalmus maximus]|uniref:Uncharacterized protein n=1 Tax=Scophthalmus maximus TaxID=52904 RepID=A0A6A4SX76_SCOMX|nr:hypothetical protein F2P81_010203 [Scophthalmus maximus]
MCLVESGGVKSGSGASVMGLLTRFLVTGLSGLTAEQGTLSCAFGSLKVVNCLKGQAQPSNIKVPGMNNPPTKRDIWPAQRGGSQFLTSTFINIVLPCGQDGKREEEGKTFIELTIFLNYTTTNKAEVKLKSAGKSLVEIQTRSRGLHNPGYNNKSKNCNHYTLSESAIVKERELSLELARIRDEVETILPPGGDISTESTTVELENCNKQHVYWSGPVTRDSHCRLGIDCSVCM